MPTRRNRTSSQRRARRQRIRDRRQAVDAAAHETWLSQPPRDMRTRWSSAHHRRGDEAKLDLDFTDAERLDLTDDAETMWMEDPGEAVKRTRMRAVWSENDYGTKGEA